MLESYIHVFYENKKKMEKKVSEKKSPTENFFDFFWIGFWSKFKFWPTKISTKIRSKKIPSIIFYFPNGGNISIGAMYRILLDKGYDVVARDQLKLRQSVRV